jgi:peptidoglycan/LPS O-acetylase OafA/YrhL
METLRKLPFRPDIQGLRAIAIAIVVFAHADVPGFSGGFVGVDIFFVLSGFLITRLLVEERLATGTIRYGTFLVRRLRRLLPALLVMAISVLCIASLLLSSYEARMQTGSFHYAVTWTSNFYFAFAEFDYFASLRAKDLFLHTWSLGIEEQFYVIWPWLMALAFALAAGRRRSGCELRILSAVIIAVFVASLGLCIYWSRTEQMLSFYMMPARGWQFALGSLVFLASRSVGSGKNGSVEGSSPRALQTLAGAVGLVLIGTSATFLHSDLNYPGLYALLPSVGTALVIHAGSGHSDSAVTRLLASRPLAWVGDRSYSLYLWHWPVLMLGVALGARDSSLAVVWLIIASMFLAAVSYRWVELPFWKGSLSHLRPRLLALSAMLAILSSCGAANVATNAPNHYSNTAADLKVAGIRADNPRIFVAGLNCDSWYHSSDVRPCETGGAEARHTVALIGDSIGTQWASVLPEIYKAPEWRVVVLTKSACAIADLEYYYKPAGGTYDVCTEWRNRSIDYLAELRPDIVFIGSSATPEFSESEWVGGTNRIVAKLAPAARHVVMVPGTPALSFDGPSCLQEPYRFTSRLRDSEYLCEEAQQSARSDEVAAYLAKSASNFGNAHVLNLNDLVCPNRRCSARSRSGIPVFRDSQHLTASFVVAQSTEVLSRLDALGVGPSALTASESTASIAH